MGVIEHARHGLYMGNQVLRMHRLVQRTLFQGEALTGKVDYSSRYA